MASISEIAQVPDTQDALLISTCQYIAGHLVPRQNVQVCVRASNAEHAAARFSHVPDTNGVVYRARGKHIAFRGAPLQILN